MKRKSIDQFFQPKKTLEQKSEHVKEQTDRLSKEDVEVDKGTDEDCEVAVEEEMSDSNNKETERELGDVRLSSQEQLGMIYEFPCQIRDSCSINAELVATDAYCINKEFVFSVLLDISKSWQEGPMQVKLNNFPKTTHGGAKRSFHDEWHKTFTWLEYSARKDAAYCFACRHFSLPDAAKSVFTSTEGYRNWKKASFKDSGFSSHAKSENHQNAMCAWAENKKRQDSTLHLLQ